jgi:acetoacetyl-CoA synthetase
LNKMLWQPGEERKAKTNMTEFIKLVNGRYGKNFGTYEELYAWSVENSPDFWALMWEYGRIIASSPYTEIVKNFDDMFYSEWFEGARLNYAENLLRYRDDRTALVFKGEAQESQKISLQ